MIVDFLTKIYVEFKIANRLKKRIKLNDFYY